MILPISISDDQVKEYEKFVKESPENALQRILKHMRENTTWDGSFWRDVSKGNYPFDAIAVADAISVYDNDILNEFLFSFSECVSGLSLEYHNDNDAYSISVFGDVSGKEKAFVSGVTVGIGYKEVKKLRDLVGEEMLIKMVEGVQAQLSKLIK